MRAGRSRRARPRAGSSLKPSGRGGLVTARVEVPTRGSCIGMARVVADHLDVGAGSVRGHDVATPQRVARDRTAQPRIVRDTLHEIVDPEAREARSFSTTLLAQEQRTVATSTEIPGEC